jgi:hypothetical protein
MRTNGTFSKGLVLALVIALFPSFAFSATKITPGSSCKTFKQKTIYQNKTYTCVKSGKKLVWDKGVSLKDFLEEKIPVDKAGDSCFVIGKKIMKDGVGLECRAGANSSKIYYSYSEIPKEFVNTSVSEDIATCRIADARLKVVQNLASIAYPAKPQDQNFTSQSRVTVAIMAIDFTNAVGTYSPVDEINAIIKESEEWTNWYTNGRLKIDWVSSNKWVRAPEISSEYDWTHPSSNVGGPDNNQQSIGASLVKIADANIDLSNVQEIYFMYPRDITKIKDSVNFTNDFQTSKGLKRLGVFARSQWIDNSNIDVATWLMHENIHRFGYAQHSPAYPGMFSLAYSDNSKSIDLWDRIVLDWLKPADIYCASLESLNSEQITLVPQEREQNGYKGVAIRLNNHKLLILESHRRDKWSPLFSDGLFGVTAMVVNTNFDTDRSGEWSRDDGKGIKFSRTANFIQFTQYNHGNYIPGLMPVDAWQMNYLLYPGENFIYGGVKVSFISSGDNDTLKVEKL